MYGIAKQILVGYALYFINCNIIAAPNVNSLQVILDPRLVIESQEISLGADKVTISTKIYNPSTENLLQTLASSQDQQVTSDNQDIALLSSKIAISKMGIDITALLKQLGVPLDPITAMHAIDASPNRESIRKQLLSNNLLDRDAETPQWVLKQFYFWRQTFPSQTKVIIKQSYKVSSINQSIKFSGNSSLLHLPIQLLKKAYSFATNWNHNDAVSIRQVKTNIEAEFPEIIEYCPSTEDYLALLNLLKKTPKKNIVDVKTINLIAPSDILTINPIKSFNLNIQHDNNSYPILCMKDKLQGSDKNNSHYEAHNYIPITNIKILYLEN